MIRFPLPDGWRWDTLGSVGTWSSGGTPKASVARYYDGPHLWAVIGDLNDGPVRTTERTITNAGLEGSSAKLVPAGTLLVAMYGSIGKLGITMTQMATNQAIACCQPGSDVHLKWLFYWIMLCREDLLHAGKGGTQSNISQTILKDWPVPVPPLAEQQAIVEAIERNLSVLDRVETTRASILARLRTLENATIEYATRGRPIPLAAGDAAEELLQVNVSLSPVQEKVSPQPPPAWLPDGWAWVTLRTAVGEEGLIRDGDWVETKDQDPDGQIRLLQLSDIGRGVFRDRSDRWVNDEAAERLGVMYVLPGDVLVSRLGDPPGDTTLVPDLGQRAITAVDVCILRPAPGAVTPEWLMWCINSPTFRDAIVSHQSGTTRKRITRSKLEQLCIPIPPLSDQRRLCEWLTREQQRLHQLGTNVDRMQAQCETLRRAILKAAFEGGLTGDRPLSNAVLDEAIA